MSAPGICLTTGKEQHTREKATEHLRWMRQGKGAAHAEIYFCHHCQSHHVGRRKTATRRRTEAR